MGNYGETRNPGPLPSPGNMSNFPNNPGAMPGVGNYGDVRNQGPLPGSNYGDPRNQGPVGGNYEEQRHQAPLPGSNYGEVRNQAPMGHRFMNDMMQNNFRHPHPVSFLLSFFLFLPPPDPEMTQTPVPCRNAMSGLPLRCFTISRISRV